MSKDDTDLGSKNLSKREKHSEAQPAAGADARPANLNRAVADAYAPPSLKSSEKDSTQQQKEAKQISDGAPEKPRRDLSSGGDRKESSTQPAEKNVNADAGKSQASDSNRTSKQPEQSVSESKPQRTTDTTGKQSEHISTTTQPEAKAAKESGSTGGNDSQTSRGGSSNKGGGDADASPRDRSSSVVAAPEARSDAGSGKANDPKGGSDGSRSSDTRSDAPKGSDATRSPEARTADTPKAGDSSKASDTARDGAGASGRDAARQDSPKDAAQRSETKSPEGGKEREPAGRPTDQITKGADSAQERTARQFEKDPLVAGKPTDAQAGKQIDQKIDGLLLDGKQVGIGQRGDKVDPRDGRSDAGQKVPDARGDVGQKNPEGRGDAGSRVGGGGADGRIDAGKRPGDGREGERIGIIGGDKGVAAGRLDVTISADAVKLHLPEKGGQEIILTDRNTQKSMNEAFGLFDQSKFKQIATDFKQHVDLWTELTSKQFGGLKDTISNVLDAPKAAAMKELSAWVQDLTKRPDAQVDVRQELGHAVKMQLLDNLKRNDDSDRRHADLKDRCVNLLDEFKQIKTDLQGRCEEAIKIARSFFAAPIERTPMVHIAPESSTKKLTDSEIDELLNERLREFTAPKSKEDEAEKAKSDGDKADDQAAAVQQAMQQASHTLKKGETVAMIAAKYCGSEECAVLIAEMNRGVISATYEQGNLVFHAPVGAVLNLPYDRDIREFKAKTLGMATNVQDGSQS